MPLPTDAFAAFERQLRISCEDEFPCGRGSLRTASEKRNPASRFSVTPRDNEASKEQEETLEELVTSRFSPDSIDRAWRQEARQLREVAVKSPWLITMDYILGHFKTVKIVNENVCNVDKGMLQFTRLMELILSANSLTNVDSRNLPKTLQILELVANDISELEQLCYAPPPGLQHLGLGLNKISAIQNYLTGPYWPHLLSLDLSYNNLCDLKEVISKLQTLPKLRNLLLIGNPLALILGYRGYAIDSLHKLTILDDIQISADEKHHFKGLMQRREFIQDKAKIFIKLSALSGIPKPPEATPELPEFPLITRTYYIEFRFLEDCVNIQEREDMKSRGQQGVEGKSPISGTLHTSNDEQLSDVGKNGNHKEVDNTDQENTTVIHTKMAGNEMDETIEVNPSQHSSQVELVPFRTDHLNWTEEMELVYEREIQTDNLAALKELFKKGLDIDVKEDKVLSYPVEEGRASAMSTVKNGKDKDGGKVEKRGASGASKTKEKPDKPNDGKLSKDDGKKKKKKQTEIELTHLPAEVTILGSYHVELGMIINGETRIEEVCICEVGSLGMQPDEYKEEETVNARKDKKKKGDAGELAKGKKSKDAKQEKGKKPAKDDGKGGKRPMSAAAPNTDEERKTLPPPLSLTVELQLVQWKTTQDSIAQLVPPVLELKKRDGKAENPT